MSGVGSLVVRCMFAVYGWQLRAVSGFGCGELGSQLHGRYLSMWCFTTDWTQSKPIGFQPFSPPIMKAARHRPAQVRSAQRPTKCGGNRKYTNCGVPARRGTTTTSSLPGWYCTTPNRRRHTHTYIRAPMSPVAGARVRPKAQFGTRRAAGGGGLAARSAQVRPRHRRNSATAWRSRPRSPPPKGARILASAHTICRRVVPPPIPPNLH